MPINEPYTGSQAYGYFQTRPQRLEYVLEPREQLAIFDWDQPKPKDLSDSFKDMERLDIDWGRFLGPGVGNLDGLVWSNRVYTDTNISISRPETTTVTFFPEIE